MLQLQLGNGDLTSPKIKIKWNQIKHFKLEETCINTIPWDTKAAGLYMICTLSKHEAEAQGFTDLMLDHEGNVAEATGANVFFKNEAGELGTNT